MIRSLLFGLATVLLAIGAPLMTLSHHNNTNELKLDAEKKDLSVELQTFDFNRADKICLDEK